MFCEMKLNAEAFEKMKTGTKTAEIRLLDEKRQKLREGDEIRFFKLPEMSESIIVRVKKLERFASFRKLFEAIDKKFFGHEGLTTEQQLERIYRIYTKEDEENLGVLAIFVELTKNDFSETGDAEGLK